MKKIIEFKTGDLILFSTPFNLFKPVSWLALAIRLVARIKYNHIGVVVMNWKKPFINEAVSSGVEMRELTNRLSKFDGDIKVLRYKRGVYESIFAIEANSQVGVKKYDYAGCMWYQLWFQVSGNKLWFGEGKNKATRRFYCYEYCAWLFRHLFTDWWKINPNHIIDSEDFTVVYEGKTKYLNL